MRQKKLGFALAALVMVAACENGNPAGLLESPPQQSEVDIDPITGSPTTGVNTSSRPSGLNLSVATDIGTAAVASFSLTTASVTFSDLDDLNHLNGYHSMSAHSPYFGMNFSSNIYHYNDVNYGPNHTGVIRLFNAFGVDNESINFPGGIYYFSAWMGEPHNDTKQVRFEGWNGSTLVDVSPWLTVTYGTSQLLEIAFTTPVTQIRVRRSPFGWWVMDDICYSSTQTYNTAECVTQPTNSAPTADAGPDQTVDLSGAHTVSVQLDGSASSDDGQIQPLSYTWSKNSSTIATGAQPTVVLDRGTHTITLTVNDGQFSASDVVTITVVDPSPPTITYDIAGTVGNNSWYVSDVAVSWTVTDLESDFTSTGCESSEVTGDTHGQSFTCSAQSAGGSSSLGVTVKRDATNPLVGFSGNTGSYTVEQHVSITCAASDATSGLASSTCPEVDADAYTLALGLHTLDASATDNAGNSSEAHASFTVSVTPASLCTLVRRWVAQHGIANSLCQKLNNAPVHAFVNEVNAQRGKAISSAHADLLIALANAL